MEELGFLLGFLVAVFTLFFAWRQFYRWWWPIRISIFLRRSINNPEEVGATITNVSNEAQGLRTFRVMGVNPIRTALWRAFKKPCAPLKSYRIFRYSQISLGILSNGSAELIVSFLDIRTDGVR